MLYSETNKIGFRIETPLTQAQMKRRMTRGGGSESRLVWSSGLPVSGQPGLPSNWSVAASWQHVSLSLPQTMVSSDFTDRPLKKLVLFDVDGTLTPARRVRRSPPDASIFIRTGWTGCFSGDPPTASRPARTSRDRLRWWLEPGEDTGATRCLWQQWCVMCVRMTCYRC